MRKKKENVSHKTEFDFNRQAHTGIELTGFIPILYLPTFPILVDE
jgi:hypothetical protein